MTSAMAPYWGGQHQPMAPRNGTEAGGQLRRELWKLASRYRSDKTVLAAIRSRYPKAAAQFPDAALVAVTRQLKGGACSWCAYRREAALAGETPARPSPALNGLLGSRCGRCQVEFRSQVVADRERASLAAAGPPPRQAVGPQAATRRPPPAFYGSRRLQQPWG